MHKNKINLLFICPYPIGQSPSQRFRFEQYFDILKARGFSIEVRSFLSRSTWSILYKPGRLGYKVFGMLRGFAGRLSLLALVGRFDFIFIHREVTPIGPPVFEWIIAKILRKKIIYDFDDAIWLTDRATESKWLSLLKWRSKVSSICKWSYKISCGNQYLCAFAKNYNAWVILNPTTIDTEIVHNPALYEKVASGKERVVIGWTGSHSTLKYLESAVTILQQIELRFPNVQIAIIADRKPELNLKTLHFIPWRSQSEIEDLMTFDIGIMPLPDDLWAKGKCGFKALQYMALNIPALASPVGVNTSIIDDGRSGLLCTSNTEWEAALSRLIIDKKLRQEIGESGRQKVIDRYSVLSNSSNFLALFE